ncbi:MAG: ABC transporter ATP-binding protein, partial [Lawsonibacter sp.]|nr:ABC transporter ATP-binding protein [Lawsonibacter sp.]
MKNCIQIRGLCKSYGDFSLKNIDLTLPGGSILGLIGENGAGKTTTIKCILNLIHRDAGEITVLGYDSVKEECLAKQDVGVVMDECFFHDTLRPRDVGKVLAPAYKNWDGDLFQSYLDKFGLPGKKLIKEFSRGMKMKLSLSAALAHHPKLLILDEATAGLDPVVRDEILDEFLGFIQDEDHAILMSSHI